MCHRSESSLVMNLMQRTLKRCGLRIAADFRASTIICQRIEPLSSIDAGRCACPPLCSAVAPRLPASRSTSRFDFNSAATDPKSASPWRQGLKETADYECSSHPTDMQHIDPKLYSSPTHCSGNRPGPYFTNTSFFVDVNSPACRR
jgi:hypothetical protein